MHMPNVIEFQYFMALHQQQLRDKDIFDTFLRHNSISEYPAGSGWMLIYVI